MNSLRNMMSAFLVAVFVVFARKAGSIRPPGVVGGWLHAVAVHTSLRARTMADRRRRRHSPLVSDPTAPLPAEPTDPTRYAHWTRRSLGCPDHNGPR